MVSLPDNDFIKRALEKLEFFVAIDFFLNETARHADIVLPGSLQEEDEGTVTQVEGRVIKINKAVDCPGEARQDWRIIQDIAQGARPRARLHVRQPARDLRRAARRHRKGGVADYSGITYEKIERAVRRVLALPATIRDGEPIDHPGTPRLFEPGSWNPVAKGAGPFYFPDGKARFNVADLRAADRGRRRRVPAHPDHRPRGQPVPVAARRRGASARWSISIPSRASSCTRGWPRSSASPTATGRPPRRAAARSRCARWS